MRLIDADNLKIPNDAPYKASVKRVVAQQPTVEAKPVVNGEWIYKSTYYEADECDCSLCGQHMTTQKGKRMNFCPNCGARMVKDND